MLGETSSKRTVPLLEPLLAPEVGFTMRYRLKFKKYGKMIYIGHLDLLTVFQRAVKRAALPVSYSKGFNPHQLMCFAAPLPLGTASLSEFVDIGFEEEVSVTALTDGLNSEMPDGLEIVGARLLPDDEKNCAAAVCAACYEIVLNEGIDGGFIEQMMNSTELMFEKKSKWVNIRLDIYSLCKSGGESLKLTAAAGSAKNLSPAHVAEYIYGVMGFEFLKHRIKYTRLEMLRECNEEFISL